MSIIETKFLLIANSISANTYADGTLYGAISYQRSSWTHAREQATAMSAKLAVFPDQGAFDFVNANITRGHHNALWVGYHRVAGAWEDISGHPPAVLPWGDGYPVADAAANCVALDVASKTLENLDCSKVLGLVITMHCPDGHAFLMPGGCHKKQDL